MQIEMWLLFLLFIVPMIFFLALNLPITFVLGGTAIFMIVLLLGPHALTMVVYTAVAQTSNFILLAIPLFVLMANVLESTAIADDLYDAVYKWFGRVPGGLAIGTVVICAIFAAMSGISGVATVTMGMIALPSMLKRGYDKKLAVGCIAAGGALGILIPPSVIFILYGALCDESVGKLFAGGVIPGILLALIFIVYIAIVCGFKPTLGPPTKEVYSIKEKLIAIKSIISPLILIIIVLGAIYTGICTATEAAGIGAFGAIVCALIQKRLTLSKLHGSLLKTLKLCCMIFYIVIGAGAFGHIFSLSGLTEWVTKSVVAMEANRWVIMGMIQFTFFILGCLLDPVGIIMICTPIFVPLIEALGFDKLWFGILFCVNMEMAYITPPFGFNLFYMKAIVPPEVTMLDVYTSIIPFVFLQAVCLVLVMIFPELALWLPGLVIGK